MQCRFVGLVQGLPVSGNGNIQRLLNARLSLCIMLLYRRGGSISVSAGGKLEFFLPGGRTKTNKPIKSLLSGS